MATFRAARRSKIASSEGIQTRLKITRKYQTIRPHPLRGPGSTSHLGYVFLSLLLLFSPLAQIASSAQTSTGQGEVASESNATPGLFRLERVPVMGGAELITIHARMEGLQREADQKWVPLVTVLRDTLGDLDPENDRLRYLWPLTYTRPTIKQRVAGAIPFLYTRVGNKKTASNKAPPPVMDLAAPERQVWEKVFWIALKNVLIDPYGAAARASTESYRRNIADYRRSHIIRALSVLSLYQAMKGPAAFSDTEMADIQGRLLLADTAFGGLVDDLHLQRYYEKKLTGVRDQRGHNWELLRQRAEAESLHFEPLEMPDGSATHAMLWVAKTDLASRQGHPYNGRFLNIADPWTDKRLLNWKGYSETHYFDAEGRSVPAETAGARMVEMIPLALYGLDNPKIPMLLVDFRDTLNPKKREMSRRVLEDVTKNVLALSPFGDLSYFLGRSVFDFVTGRRGMDINQPSRLRTYSQLKLLLSLNDSLNPQLRAQIDGRLEKVSLNPMENDLAVEAKLAKGQYEALMAYAQRADGLPAKLDRDRRAEMVPLEHGRTAQVFLRVANIVSFGKYTHREKASQDLEARLDITRRLSYHTRLLRKIGKSSPQVEIAWNLDEVNRSLQFLAEHAAEADSNAASAAARIFALTEDNDTRRRCLDSLSRMNTRRAKDELLRLSEDRRLDPTWTAVVVSYLNSAGTADPLVSSAGKPGANRVEQR
ncbi:MAG: hypothetical protein ND866_12570 [Pyrinomonadaceae bacterium]|nr:hypothetical protein [Pyrinomonadaceae bacterium]